MIDVSQISLYNFARRAARLPGLRSLARRFRPVLQPAGRPSGRFLPRRPPAEGCEGLTVLSANLWHDWPRHRRLADRLEAFARLVEAEGVDVILLQEVARTSTLQVDAWLADRLDMAYVYSRANGHAEAIGFEEGLAVFSRFPLVEPHLKQLSPVEDPFVRRLALGAALDTPCGEILAVSVHLSLRPARNAAQMARLQTWIDEVARQRTILIGGDFNAREASKPISQAQRAWLDLFRHVHPHGDATTHELRWPWGTTIRKNRLDYVFLQPGEQSWSVLTARHVQAHGLRHSDHQAVLARLAPLSL